jgi:hypothetical protein
MLRLSGVEVEVEAEEGGKNCLALVVEFVVREISSKHGEWRECGVEGGGGETFSRC